MLKRIKPYGKKHCRLPDASPQKIQRIDTVVSLAITGFQPCCASRLVMPSYAATGGTTGPYPM